MELVHSFAKLKNDPRSSLPDSFSVCSTLLSESCKSYHWPLFFNILDDQGSQLFAAWLTQGSVERKYGIDFAEGSAQRVVEDFPPLFSNEWTRSCMAINTTSGLIHWVAEGTLVLDIKSEEMRKSPPRNLAEKVVLGASSYGGYWFAESIKVTNLNIFASFLSIERMEEMTRDCVDEGDYLAWEDMEWILQGQSTLETVDVEEPCEGEPWVNLYYTQFPNMDACMRHCQKMGSKSPPVSTFEDWTRLQTFLKTKLFDKGLHTMEVWLPIEDRKIEGEWRDFYSGGLIQDYTQPWIGSKPDGGTGQNCAIVADENSWADRECDVSNHACVCNHNPTPFLTLRGLCPTSSLDVHYKPMNDWEDIRQLTLQGLTKTSITYSMDEKAWTLYVSDSNVTGQSKATHASFTLGKHNWTITGDEDCSTGEPYVLELKMSGCREDEFTCNDGQCVRMDQRCNQLPNCRDKSDERSCNILVLENGYNKNVPPITADENVNVSVSIDLLKLVNIDEDDYSIEIQFEIVLQWRENRATFHNLKTNDNLNALTQHDIETLWLPNVIYENTDQKETTRLGEVGNGEWKTKVVVRREGNSSRSGPEMIDEIEIFSGSQNMLIMSQTYTHRFQCPYELSHYPFDTQVYSS